MRLLDADPDPAGKEAIELATTRVVHTPHLRYTSTVARRSRSTMAEAVRGNQ
ncbi:MAG TPA: hypothetical protein VFV66_29930 [Nonomuraea sp.]|nr:hypothetical protein [Nonomuraea sp.]